MIEFKEGDIVKCIDNSHCEPYLSLGGMYKIISITSLGDIVVNLAHGKTGWVARRFRLVHSNTSNEKSLDDAFDEPDSVHWAESVNYPCGSQVVSFLTPQGSTPTHYDITCEQALKYPETKPVVAKKSVEQLAIDVLYNTTGKLYAEREIIAITTIVSQIKELEK